MPLDTIYALSSGHGRAAIAVVRVSGPEARSIIQALTGSVTPVRQACFRAIRHPTSGEAIDHGVVMFFAAPHSATGEDVAEFHVHGGRAVLNAVFDVLAGFDGCRPAEPGEFARRGFENGKFDAAIKLIAKALAVDPEMADAHTNLGLALQELGKPDHVRCVFWFDS